MSALTGVTVGFIGAGRMATALARGLIASGAVSGERILACDVSAQACSRFSAETGALTVADPAAAWDKAGVVVLAVKPQQMSEVLQAGREHARAAHLVVSVAAGVTLQTLAQGLGSDRRVVRVMPNTPCLIGAGASAYSLGEQATAEDGELVRAMLATVGIAVEVPETLLDAVTGLSGSGPAYIYQVIEAISDGGVRMGLPRDVATQLAAQTVLGAARMVLETGEHPGVLKDAVASPGGTTIAGLHALENGGLRGCLMNAVEAATRRSQELGRS